MNIPDTIFTQAERHCLGALRKTMYEVPDNKQRFISQINLHSLGDKRSSNVDMLLSNVKTNTQFVNILEGCAQSCKIIGDSITAMCKNPIFLRVAEGYNIGVETSEELLKRLFY